MSVRIAVFVRRMASGWLVLGMWVASARGQMLDGRMHHLRSGATREWDEFPEKAEGSDLLFRFEAAANASPRTLRLRHRDLKQQWIIQLNGSEIARLPQDENAMVTCWNVPAGALREGQNELRIACSGGPSDDIDIGEVELLEGARAAVLSEASIEVNVIDADQ